MVQYVLRRILIAVPMLLGAMSIVFFAMRVLPGNPCVAMMGDQATTERSTISSSPDGSSGT